MVAPAYHESVAIVNRRGRVVVSRYPGKKLPPHWVYIPSPREVRKLLNEFADNVTRLECAGTGSEISQTGLIRLGYLERRVVEGAWCFNVRLDGAPESAVINRYDELSRAAILAIRRSISECLMIPPTDLIKPTHLNLWFRIGLDGVRSECHVQPIHPWYPTGIWWMNPSRD